MCVHLGVGCMQFAHRKCIQRWCNKKGNITCEICNQVGVSVNLLQYHNSIFFLCFILCTISFLDGGTIF